MVKAPLTLELALLGFLTAGPMHAYEMHQRLRETDGLALIWRIKLSRLYALLARLEAEGYITAATSVQTARPPRHMLSLTAMGRAVFAEWLTTPVTRLRQLRQVFLAKLYFAMQAGPEAAATLIAGQRRACAVMLEDANRQAATATTSYTRRVYRFRAEQAAAALVWLDEEAAIASRPSDSAGRQ
jgi:DNA-binding PadR family transcriptional regulator